MIGHERIEELLAAKALGGLDTEDLDRLERERSEHGAGCSECARLEREYGDVAGRLAFALDPVPMRAGVEDEIVARATEAHGRTRFANARPSGWRRLGTLAAAAALALGGWVLRDLTATEPVGPPADFLAQADLVRFEGSSAGRLAIAYRPGDDEAYLFGTEMPAPEDGAVYELWLFEDDRPVRAGCFSTDDGTVAERLEADVAGADLLAVTVESEACPDAPTTQPVLTAEPTVA